MNGLRPPTCPGCGNYASSFQPTVAFGEPDEMVRVRVLWHEACALDFMAGADLDPREELVTA